MDFGKAFQHLMIAIAVGGAVAGGTIVGLAWVAKHYLWNS